jgi:perosamine synthetase
VFHQYTIRLEGGRDEVQKRLETAGVGSAIHYPIPIHQQPIIKQLGHGDFDLPVAEQASRQVLSLPIHPSLSEGDIERIAAAVDAAVRG